MHGERDVHKLRKCSGICSSNIHFRTADAGNLVNCLFGIKSSSATDCPRRVGSLYTIRSTIHTNQTIFAYALLVFRDGRLRCSSRSVTSKAVIYALTYTPITCGTWRSHARDTWKVHRMNSS